MSIFSAFKSKPKETTQQDQSTSSSQGKTLGTADDNYLYTQKDVDELDKLTTETINVQARKLLLMYHKHIKNQMIFQPSTGVVKNAKQAAIARNQQQKIYDMMDRRVLNIHEMLPDLALQDIALVLTEARGSEELAIDMLLNNRYNVEELKQKYATSTDQPATNSVLTRPVNDIDEIIGLVMLEQRHIERQKHHTALNTAKTLEEQYLKQIELKQMLQEEKKILGLASDSPSTAGTPNSSNVLAFERKMVEKRLREERLQRNGRFFCQGEVQALQGTKMKRYPLTITNRFDCDAEQIHFRIAESQFHRQGSSPQYGSGGAYKVTSVEYIVNPLLVQKFNQCKINLAQKHGFLVESMKPLLLFHGTSEVNMENIINTNFLLEKIGSATDMGWYGKGFYFSEFPGMSISYSRGNPYLLICLVLVGRAHRMEQVNTGCPKVDGYDSHVSPDGCSEVIIFDPDQVLPCYKVRYEACQQGSYH